MHEKLDITLPIATQSQPSWLKQLRRYSRFLFARIDFPPLQRLLRRVFAVAKPSTRLVLRRPLEQSPEIAPCQPLTIISANLWHDWPLYRRLPERLESFAKAVEQHRADIIMLQEVPRTSHLIADEWLTARLGMYSLYARANGDAQVGFEEGLAVFSRYPLQQPQVHLLQPGAIPFVRRLALAALVDTPCGRLWTISVHLALLKAANRRQYVSLRQFVDQFGDELPIIIGGDFNAHEECPHIKSSRTSWLDTFRQSNPFGDGTTHGLRFLHRNTLHRRRLDYIFLRNTFHGWRVIESHHLMPADIPHSDHHMVLTRIAPAKAGAGRLLVSA